MPVQIHHLVRCSYIFGLCAVNLNLVYLNWMFVACPSNSNVIYVA